MEGTPRKFPFTIHELPEDVALQGSGMRDAVLIGPKKFCFPRALVECLDDLYNFEIRSDDVWIFGIPRSGTTLAQEMVWLLGNNLDYEEAAKTVMDLRFPIPEHTCLLGEELSRVSKDKVNKQFAEVVGHISESSLVNLKKARGKRFIKTHLPLSFFSPQLLKSGCKVFYLARNPRDVCVSQYHFLDTFRLRSEDMAFATFWNNFKLGTATNTNYFNHVTEGWELREHSNFKFLYYDHYTMDMKRTTLEVASFLGVSLSKDQLDGLLDHLNIDNFRKNKSVNNDHLRTLGVMKDKEDSFIRKGKRGGWRDYFVGNLKEEAEQWIEDNLKRTGIELPM